MIEIVSYVSRHARKVQNATLSHETRLHRGQLWTSNAPDAMLDLRYSGPALVSQWQAKQQKQQQPRLQPPQRAFDLNLNNVILVDSRSDVIAATICSGVAGWFMSISYLLVTLISYLPIE